MVKLLSLYAGSFKKLKFDEPLKFPDGITVVSGFNEAGKSTMLDAILYALYGRVVRPSGHVKDADLIGYGTGKANVTLDFGNAGHVYRVKREIFRNRPNTAMLLELFPEGRTEVLAAKVKEVTSMVEKLLGGITYNEIVSSNVVAQKDLDRLVRERSDRPKVINAFLNLESFNTVFENLNEERKDLEGTGVSRPGIINVERQKLEKIHSELEEFKRRKDEVTELRTRIDELGHMVSKQVSRHSELQSLHETLVEYDGVLTLKNQLRTELDGKKEVLKRYEDQVNELNAHISEMKDKLNNNFADLPSDSTVSEIQARLESLRNHVGRQRDAEQRVEKVEHDVLALKNDLGGFDRQELEKLRKIRIRMKPYVAGTFVSLLTTLVLLLLSVPIIPWIAGAVTFLLLIKLSLDLMEMNRLARLEGMSGKAELLNERNQELSSLSHECAAEAAQTSSTRRSLIELVAGIERYQDLFKRADRPEYGAQSVISQFSKDREEKSNLESGIRSLKDSLDKTITRVNASAIQSEIKALNEEIAKTDFPRLPEGVDFSKQLLEGVSREKEDTWGKIESEKSTIEALRERVQEDELYIEEHKDIQDDVKSQEKAVQDLEHRLKVVRAAVEGVAKTAENLRMRVRPSVERYMGQILPSITDGKYKVVMLDQEFGVQVWDPEAGEFRPKEVFSGGTEDQFLLAMRLAFALALIPEAKGAKPDFLFLDEPLGSSDEVRRSGIIEYLSVNLSKMFSQIFIISHVGGLEELVPNVVRLENGRVVS